jgi:lysophospholipase L1-like esterase
MYIKNVFKRNTTFYIGILLILLLFIGSMSIMYAAPTRIMPLGDSITGSPGCWRALLWKRLQDNGYTNIDFVGTQPPQGCGIEYDGDNEGHGGALATNVADQNQLVGWLSSTNPDIVLMHFGTNDCWSGRDTSVILAAFSKLVDQMRENNPNMKILVAQIIPMDPAQSCSDCDQRVIALNNAIPGWAIGKSTSQSPITVVDQWTGFSTASDTYDGVHPNDSGDQKMADKWYAALTPLLSGSPVDTPTPTAPTQTTPPVLLGDVNSSGGIDIVDALMVAQYYVGLSPSNFNTAAADVTGDGNIDIVDALRIAQCYVGLISCNF